MKKLNRVGLLIHWILMWTGVITLMWGATASNLVKETPDAMLLIFPTILLGYAVYRSLIFIWRLNDAGKLSPGWIIFVLLNPVDTLTLIILMFLSSKEK